jgi:hypothetical protein
MRASAATHGTRGIGFHRRQSVRWSVFAKHRKCAGMGEPTETYLSLISELERRRRKLKWPMWLLDDKAGGQDSYWSKMVACHAPSGRQAGWEILQLYVTALFPRGCRIKVIPCPKETDARTSEHEWRERPSHRAK